MSDHRIGSRLTWLLLALAAPSALVAQISIQITIGPPPIPVYEQPMIPDSGYAWTPGYWAWGDDGYYWVPGTWVRIPEVGLLWTPGYWGWEGEYFMFHRGYWGHHVGFYGGINYGYGYGGEGFEGGYWEGQRYYYNRAVTNVNTTTITNVYNKTVIVNNNTYIAYNGGTGGVTAAPTERDRTWAREQHVQPTAEQTRQHEAASRNRELLASVNRGKPPVAATVRPADFSPKNVVPAKAPGGRVPEAVLKATPKTLPPPVKSPAPGAKPAEPAPEPKARPKETPRERPVPAPAPTPRPPEPIREPAPHPVPRPKEEPPVQPLPDRHPAPAPHPNPEPDRKPAPRPDPQPAPRPQPPNPERPDPERRPVPAPHPTEKAKPKPKPAPAPKPKPDPKPDKDKDKERG